MTTTSTRPDPTAEAYAERVFNSTLATMETLSLYVGERLGWWRSLAHDGSATAAELAARTGTHERYSLEWLEMQAALGTLTTEDGGTRAERRFTLPPGPAEVLTDEHSLAYLGALPRVFGAVGRQLDGLLDAYRHGGGVSWAELGDDAREAQAALNRPWFESRLAAVIQQSPELHAALSSPGARIADVGCGAGWSTIALARAYPQAQLVGFDIDPPSIDMARAAAAEAAIEDRMSFLVAEGETLTEHNPFDVAFAFECVHDMPRPVEVLSAIRRSVRPEGQIIIVDEAVSDEFVAPAGPVDQLMYGFSMFVCLPDGLSSEPSQGTGTVFRRPILEDYARRAGFRGVSVLPIEDFAFFRFYRLER